MTPLLSNKFGQSNSAALLEEQKIVNDPTEVVKFPIVIFLQ